MKLVGFTCLFALMFCCCSALEPYHVEFQGVDNPELLDQLRSASQLVALEKTASVTAAALRRRADSDIPRLLKVLHNDAYYNARIGFSYDFEQTPVLVTIAIELGPMYPLACFTIIPPNLVKIDELPVGEPATPTRILGAEERLLYLLARKGFPYASILKRDVVADQESKTVSVTLEVNPGSAMLFGKTTIEGNCSVWKEFFYKKIAWQQGCPFDPAKLLETQNALEEARLFNVVNITYPETVPAGETVPISISVVEAKHRSIGAGLSYSTQLGPGVEFEWEHRNFYHMGQTLRSRANILGRKQEGSLQYIQPDVFFRCQDLIWSADYGHEVTKGYRETYYSLSSIFQHRLTSRTSVSYGLMVKELKNSASSKDGSYHLIKTPLSYRWMRTNNFLDPTRGGSIYIRSTPTAQIISPKFIYSINTLTGTYYLSLLKDPCLVFAMKGIVGTILGTTRKEIPPSERFYAGSETTLRGYRYMTVSPTSPEGNPIGGRSMLIGSFELRWRVTDTIGAAYFYDVGNVYSGVVPNLSDTLLNSLGAGIRYYTPVGPIRADVAFPINRRKGIDPKFQFYLSIGQAF